MLLCRLAYRLSRTDTVAEILSDTNHTCTVVVIIAYLLRICYGCIGCKRRIVRRYSIYRCTYQILYYVFLSPRHCFPFSELFPNGFGSVPKQFRLVIVWKKIHLIVSIDPSHIYQTTVSNPCPRTTNVQYSIMCMIQTQQNSKLLCISILILCLLR